MGRPINRKHIGDGAGKIQATAVRFASGDELASSVEAHILRQKGTKRFVVATAAVPDGQVCTLVNKFPGDLGVSEFCIITTDDGGSQSKITKLRNRTIQLANVYNTKWVRTATGLLPTVEHAITAIALTYPVRVTIGAGHGIVNDTKVSIRGIVGTTELNAEGPPAYAGRYTVTGTASTTIDLAGIDGTSGYTAYTSGGVVTVSPDSIAGEADVTHIDSQAT